MKAMIIANHLDGKEEIVSDGLLSVDFYPGNGMVLSVSVKDGVLEIHTSSGNRLVVQPCAANMIYVGELLQK